MRVGLGEDSHRLEVGGPLRLGGVEIPHDRHLVGHSDADALLHAITDAILGAACLPDIGRLFPDNAAENRDRDSGDMLLLAYQRVSAAGWQIANIDCVVSAQRPKLAPFHEPMRERIAELLKVSPDQVGIKAKTGEGVGLVGTEQIISVRAVALLQQA